MQFYRIWTCTEWQQNLCLSCFYMYSKQQLCLKIVHNAGDCHKWSCVSEYSDIWRWDTSFWVWLGNQHAVITMEAFNDAKAPQSTTDMGHNQSDSFSITPMLWYHKTVLQCQFQLTQSFLAKNAYICLSDSLLCRNYSIWLLFFPQIKMPLKAMLRKLWRRLWTEANHVIFSPT